MDEETKRGIRDVYWDLGLRIRWLKMPFTELRKHREGGGFQFLTNVKMLHVLLGWVEIRRSFLDIVSLQCLVGTQVVIFSR